MSELQPNSRGHLINRRRFLGEVGILLGLAPTAVALDWKMPTLPAAVPQAAAEALRSQETEFHPEHFLAPAQIVIRDLKAQILREDALLLVGTQLAQTFSIPSGGSSPILLVENGRAKPTTDEQLLELVRPPTGIIVPPQNEPDNNHRQMAHMYFQVSETLALIGDSSGFTQPDGGVLNTYYFAHMEYLPENGATRTTGLIEIDPADFVDIAYMTSDEIMSWARQNSISNLKMPPNLQNILVVSVDQRGRFSSGTSRQPAFGEQNYRHYIIMGDNMGVIKQQIDTDQMLVDFRARAS